MYIVRIHCEFCNDFKFFDKLKVFMVKETDASRDHYQGLFKDDRKLGTIRASFKKFYPKAVGNSGYSIKLSRESVDDYITYLCKGTKSCRPDVVLNRWDPEITQEEIEIRYNKYWSVNAQLKEKVKGKKSVIQQILQEFPPVQSYEGVVESIVNWLVSHEKPLNETYIKGLAGTIYCQMNGENIRRYVRNLVQKNMFA